MSKFVLSGFGDEIDEKLDVQLDVMRQLNIHHIELRGVDGRNITTYDLAAVQKIKAILEDMGFGVSAIGSPLGKISITEDFLPHLETLKHTLEIARILETKYIRMFSFFIPKGESPDRYRKQVFDRLHQFAEAAEAAGVILLHENEKGIYGDTAERCLDLLETVNSPFFQGIFDPANFVQCGEETYPKAFSMLQKHIVYMHIKDALYEGGKVVPAGQGDGRVKEIFTELQQSGWSGFLSLEPHLGNFQGFAATLHPGEVGHDLPESGAKSFSMAAKALRGLLSQI